MLHWYLQGTILGVVLGVGLERDAGQTRQGDSAWFARIFI